jgi:hypothetical protein
MCNLVPLRRGGNWLLKPMPPRWCMLHFGRVLFIILKGCCLIIFQGCVCVCLSKLNANFPIFTWWLQKHQQSFKTYVAILFPSIGKKILSLASGTLASGKLLSGAYILPEGICWRLVPHAVPFFHFQFISTGVSATAKILISAPLWP